MPKIAQPGPRTRSSMKQQVQSPDCINHSLDLSQSVPRSVDRSRGTATYLFLYIGGGMPAHNGNPGCSFSGENSRAPVSPARAIPPKLFTARFPSVCIGPLFRYLALERLPETCYARRASSRSPLCGSGYPALVAHCASNDSVGGLDLWESKRQQPLFRRCEESSDPSSLETPSTQYARDDTAYTNIKRFTRFFNFLRSCPAVQFSFLNIACTDVKVVKRKDSSLLFFED